MQNTIKEKFNIYEPLLGGICRMEDKYAGKLVRLIYRYVFYGEEFENERKDIAEIKFWAKQSDIEKMKKEQRTKNNIQHIIFYNFYAGLFDILNDSDAGRLFKKIVDEELGTEYLKDAYDLTVIDNYSDIKDMYKRYRSEKVKNKLKEKHDFSKIRNDFPNITWNDFDPSIYKQIDSDKLYEYIEGSVFSRPDKTIDFIDVVGFYHCKKDCSYDKIKKEYSELDWSKYEPNFDKNLNIDFDGLYDYMKENNYHGILLHNRMTADDVMKNYNRDKRKRKK